MPRWLNELEAAMAAADGQDARIAAFVSTQLRLVAHGSHRMAELLGDAPLGPAVRARINALAYRPAALLEPELGPRDPKLVAQLVQGVVNAGVLDHPQLTCWNDNSGQRAYVLTLEPYRALTVAGWMLAGRAPQWEQLAAEAAVMLITTINHDPPPVDGAASLFLALARHQARAGKRDPASFDYLARIGAIEPSLAGFPRSTVITVFYHSQSPGDGDIPVSGNAYAKKQLGAIMDAWRSYSSRTDRDTPWYQQQGAAAVNGQSNSPEHNDRCAGADVLQSSVLRRWAAPLAVP